jgi:hypothetical protein
MFINVYFYHEDYYYQIQNILVYIDILECCFEVHFMMNLYINVIINMMLIDITLMTELICLDEQIIKHDIL